MNIYIQVVIFNKKMTNSATLLTLNQQQNALSGHDGQLILNIHDNSKHSCMEPEFLSKLQNYYTVNYTHTPQNYSLREIYNECINYMESEDILLLLDDDTTLPLNYIQVLQRNIIENTDSVLFVPKVIVNNKLYSPYKSYSFISRPLRDIKPGIIYSRNHAFINSGLAIRGRFFIESGFKYPGNVEFYGTDTIFSHVFRTYKIPYILMDLTIAHDVNNHPGNTNANNYAGALSKVIKFWFTQLHGLSKVAYIIYMSLYILKMTIKFRNLIFIKMFIGLK